MSDCEKEKEIMSNLITHGPIDCPEMPEKFIFEYVDPVWKLHTTWQTSKIANQVSDTMTSCPWCRVELYKIIPQKNTGVVIQTYCRVNGNTGVKTESVQVELDVAIPVPSQGSKVELTWTGKN